MDYDLSRLNSRSFEQLMQGIAVKVLGAGTVIFGDGPDGGREAAIDGQIPYPSETENWEGTTVLQAKFRQRPEGTSVDGEWAVERLKQEIASYAEVDSPREWPDQLIFATNVTLSPVKGAGTKDRMFELADESKLRGFDVWDYDKLRVYLDQFDDLRRAFAAYILPGDVLAETVAALESISSERPGFDDAMARFLQKELLADQWANLEQAGRSDDEQVPISRVFVDLPFSDQRQPDPPVESSQEDLMPGFVAHVVEAASHRLDPASLNSQRGNRESEESSPSPSEGRLVLLGGPGQGKSTVGQFVCQMFRAALLRTRPPDSLSDEVTDALSALEDQCGSDELSLPTVMRFPLRVELSKFADDLSSPDAPKSLLEYLAKLISTRIQGEVSPALMSTWLAEYPWLLILDGLDEVPASSNREDLMAAIQDFWIDTSQDNADCLVIATTRPQGYSEEFSPRYYRHTWLTPLSTVRALHYADRLLGVRFSTNSDRREDISGRLQRAASRPDTARLMTSPLQVTIMATLLERMGQPPEGRWNLFSQYYRVIYDREVEREIPAASVLSEYKPDIDAIHRRVGLLLQVENESADQVEPQISRERFTEIVHSRLHEEGHDVEGDDVLVKQIIDTAMDRLVFLVGVEADQVGFEIRSLQEFMAAEALLDGNDATVATRLRRIAPLPTWRNVFLFAAGRCFSDLQHLRDTIHTICVELNDVSGDLLAKAALPGSVLAIDLLADGVANRQRKYERLLGLSALRVVRRPPGELHDRLAEVFRPESLRKTYEEELTTALAVEPFSDSLGAWRTVAVLGSRSEDWAFDLLEKNLPGADDLGILIQSLPPSAKSRWLAQTLVRLCISSPPLQSLPHGAMLESLKVVEIAPSWFRAFAELFGGTRAESPEGTFRFEDSDQTSFSVRLRLVKDTWGPISRAMSEIKPGDRENAPKSWRALFAAIDFARDASAQALADALEEFAKVENIGMLEVYSTCASWPLASILLSVDRVEELNELAAAARNGHFGERAHWVTAESRWRRRLKEADLGQPDRAYPYNRDVSGHGFPLVAAIMSVGTFQPSRVDAALGWLDLVDHPPTRRFICDVVFWLVSGLSPDSGVAFPRAAAIAKTMHEADLDGMTFWSLNALRRLEWSEPLGEDEIRLLDRLGASIERVHNHFGVIPPTLIPLMIRAWRENPERVGLFRLIAYGAQLDVAVDVLHPLLTEEAPDLGARALLGLKLAEPPDRSALEALAAEGETWIPAAVNVMGVHPDTAMAEAAVGILGDYLSLAPSGPKAEIAALASELIARRPSGLAQDETWDSLGLFHRPQRPQPEGDAP